MEAVFYLANMKALLDDANKHLNKVPCECDSHNGFECIIHDWERRLSRLRDEVGIAIENQH